MGFALWIDGDLAWAQGTHEYRPMGAAVIAGNGVFAPRDFHPHRKSPYRHSPEFIGFFASLMHVNVYLKGKRRRVRSRAMSIL